MLVQLYILIFFSDLTDQDFGFRSDLGLLSIFITVSNFGLHVTLLFINSIKEGKRFVKRKCLRKRKKGKKQKMQDVRS